MASSVQYFTWHVVFGIWGGMWFVALGIAFGVACGVWH